MSGLTAAFVRTVKPTERLRRYGDGNGLYLLVKPGPRGGGKSWVQRLVIHGARRDLGLGGADLVTLAEARQAAWDNRRIARAGGDPRANGSRVSPTFAEAAEKVIAMHRQTWREGGRSELQWRGSLAAYVHPYIGRKPVHMIDTSDVMAVLMPIWTSKHETAKRVRHRLSGVMKWAIAQGYRADNPAGEALGAALPKVDPSRTHFRALPYDRVGAALAKIRQSDGNRSARLAFEFMVLCAVRSGEARRARWDEIDLAGAAWTIPAERMKAGREHRVPLSDRALSVLEEAESIREGDLVFPSPRRDTPLSSATLGKLLSDCGIDAVPHGFRSSFRDWAAERTETPHAVMEAALAHVTRNAVEAAYARSDLFERRLKLMCQWSDYVDRTASEDVPPQAKSLDIRAGVGEKEQGPFDPSR